VLANHDPSAIYQPSSRDQMRQIPLHFGRQRSDILDTDGESTQLWFPWRNRQVEREVAVPRLWHA
jgi:hypothetical protein